MTLDWIFWESIVRVFIFGISTRCKQNQKFERIMTRFVLILLSALLGECHLKKRHHLDGGQIRKDGLGGVVRQDAVQIFTA